MEFTRSTRVACTCQMCVSKDEQRAVNELECETEAKKQQKTSLLFQLTRVSWRGIFYNRREQASAKQARCLEDQRSI